MKYIILFLIPFLTFAHTSEKKTVLWVKAGKDQTETVVRTVTTFDDTQGKRTETKTEKVVDKK